MDAPELVIDTNVIIDYKKRRTPGKEALERAMRLYDCCLTLITVYELYWGAEYVQRLQEVEELLKPFRFLNLDCDTVRISARESVRLTKMGQRLDVMDILTAGICLKLNIPILTGNKEHFAHIPNLKVLTPAELVGEEG